MERYVSIFSHYHYLLGEYVLIIRDVRSYSSEMLKEMYPKVKSLVSLFLPLSLSFRFSVTPHLLTRVLCPFVGIVVSLEEVLRIMLQVNGFE